MTNAETLRKAAKLLRKTAKNAAPGPWHAAPVWSSTPGGLSAVYSYAHPTGTVESEVVASGRVRPGYGGIRNPHNAVWIALSSPVIAEPLAAWLDSAAQEAEEIGADFRAVAFARALLGEEADR